MWSGAEASAVLRHGCCTTGSEAPPYPCTVMKGNEARRAALLPHTWTFAKLRHLGTGREREYTNACRPLCCEALPWPASSRFHRSYNKHSMTSAISSPTNRNGDTSPSISPDSKLPTVKPFPASTHSSLTAATSPASTAFSTSTPGMSRRSIHGDSTCFSNAAIRSEGAMVFHLYAVDSGHRPQRVPGQAHVSRDAGVPSAGESTGAEPCVGLGLSEAEYHRRSPSFDSDGDAARHSPMGLRAPAKIRLGPRACRRPPRTHGRQLRYQRKDRSLNFAKVQIKGTSADGNTSQATTVRHYRTRRPRPCHYDSLCPCRTTVAPQGSAMPMSSAPSRLWRRPTRSRWHSSARSSVWGGRQKNVSRIIV